jgi:chemotaxis protein MotB
VAEALMRGAGQARRWQDRDAASGTGAGWESTYMGFVMIVLCFFVMLASHSSLQRSKLREFARSIETALGVLPGGRSLLPAETTTATAAGMDGQRAGEVDALFATLRGLSRRYATGGEISLAISDRGPVMRLSERTLFASGSADISPRAVPLLRQIAATLAASPWELRIEGHTDDVPIHALRYPSNWELSTARAVNVLRVFLQEARLDRRRVSAAGFGQERPLYPNTSQWGRARNRRVEILFIQAHAQAAAQGADAS